MLVAAVSAPCSVSAHIVESCDLGTGAISINLCAISINLCPLVAGLVLRVLCPATYPSFVGEVQT